MSNMLKIGKTFDNEVYKFDDSKRISTLVLGASGSGKSTGATNFLFNKNIADKSTYIILNGKESETLFREQLINNNKEFINLKIRPGNEFKINIFKRMNTIEQISTLKEMLVSMLTFESSFYKDLSISIVNYVLEACFYAKIELYYDTFIKNLCEQGIRNLTLKCKDLNLPLMPPDLESKEVISALISLKSRYYSVFSLAGSYIYISSQDKEAKEIDIIDVLSKGISLEFSFNSLSFPDLSHALGTQAMIWVNQFVDAKPVNQNVEIILDEVTSFLSGPRSLQLLDNLLSRGRSYKTRTSILGQSLNGFTRLVDESNSFVENLASNLTTLIAFETGSNSDLEWIANFIGSTETPFYTRQVEFQGTNNVPMLTKMGTHKFEHTYKIGPETIKYLSVNYAPYYCVILNKRQSNRPAIINIR